MTKEERYRESKEMFQYILETLADSNQNYATDHYECTIDMLGMFSTCPLIVRRWLKYAGIKFKGMSKYRTCDGFFKIEKTIRTQEELKQFIEKMRRDFEQEPEGMWLFECVMNELIEATQVQLEYNDNLDKVSSLQKDLSKMRKFNKLFE